MELFNGKTRIIDLSGLPRIMTGKPQIEKIAWFKDHVYWHRNSVLDADNISFCLEEDPGEHIAIINGQKVQHNSSGPHIGCAPHGLHITTLATTRRNELLFRYRSGTTMMADYPFPKQNFVVTPRFSALLNGLEDLLDHLTAPGTADRLDLLALDLILEARIPQTKGPQIRKSVQELYERIMSRPGDDFNIETLAEDANLSRATFYREWKKLSARSPYQLLLQNRINIAKWLLKQTGMTVQDVARQAGFRNCSVFAETFRKQTGCSPQEYRNRS